VVKGIGCNGLRRRLLLRVQTRVSLGGLDDIVVRTILPAWSHHLDHRRKFIVEYASVVCALSGDNERDLLLQGKAHCSHVNDSGPVTHWQATRGKLDPTWTT